MTPLATLENVCFRYAGDSYRLLEEMSFEIRPREILLLAGPSGSGKSTILGLLTGRLAPSQGTVRVFGHDPTGCTRIPVVGLITEPFHPDQSPLPVDLTGHDILAWLSILDGVEPQAVTQMLDKLFLCKGLLDYPLSRLSKGERQRMLLLVALLRQPRLILADEPMEGVDQVSRQAISACLRNYVDATGCGLLWVSHHLGEVVDFSDRILEIEDRSLIERRNEQFSATFSTSQGVQTAVKVATLQALPRLFEDQLKTSDTVRIELRREGGPE